MITTNDKNAYYEVSEIFKILQDDLKNKIPTKLIDFIDANKATNHTFIFDSQKSIDEQDLLPQTQEILTIIYKDYLCDESEKALINSLMEENEKKIKKQQPSTNDKLSKNSDISINKNTSTEQTKIIVVKESFFQKIINKFKKIFKII